MDRRKLLQGTLATLAALAIPIKAWPYKRKLSLWQEMERQPGIRALAAFSNWEDAEKFISKYDFLIPFKRRPTPYYFDRGTFEMPNGSSCRVRVVPTDEIAGYHSAWEIQYLLMGGGLSTFSMDYLRSRLRRTQKNYDVYSVFHFK